jgi:hypothetical protein
MVGDDGTGNQLDGAWRKVDPCRNIDGPQNLGSPARYIECMEFFLAPYPIGGGQGAQRKRLTLLITPGFTRFEGCSPDTLQAAVEACCCWDQDGTPQVTMVELLHDFYPLQYMRHLTPLDNWSPY